MINECLSGVCAQMSEQFVGTGVLDCPHKNEKFEYNYVNKCMTFYRCAILFFMYSRVAEGVDPYNRAGCKSLKFPFILPFLQC